jgi:hypothetical protein
VIGGEGEGQLVGFVLYLCTNSDICIVSTFYNLKL